MFAGEHRRHRHTERLWQSHGLGQDFHPFRQHDRRETTALRHPLQPHAVSHRHVFQCPLGLISPDAELPGFSHLHPHPPRGILHHQPRIDLPRHKGHHNVQPHLSGHVRFHRLQLTNLATGRQHRSLLRHHSPFSCES